MCGLVGFYTPEGFNNNDASAILKKMTDTLTHRGPDDSGQWANPDAGIILGHRRLSIIDLTDAGHQPMKSISGRFILVLNGEIYNHLELRSMLGQWPWNGHSDTETLLAGIQHWGLEKTIKLSIGMFAMALWDNEMQTLSLVRDRMGEKPLYYGWQGKSFLFGSELKALREHPDFIENIDCSALSLYVRQGYISAPSSIYEGIKKLNPGSILEINKDSLSDRKLEPRFYWSLPNIITLGSGHRFNGLPAEAVVELEGLLIEAITRQQIADVPLGAFLSGGIDSSIVVALMQSISSVPVKTFTIGFEQQGYNEAAYARAVAEHLKTDHTELYISSKDAISVIPNLPKIYDEPFADPSQIPTILVSRLARQHVTVALSGDGGDELFCGYGRYTQTVNKWGRLSVLPFPFRSFLQQVLPNGALSEGIACKNIDRFYKFMNSQWKGYPNLVLGKGNISASEQLPYELNDAKERMMYSDTLNYLPDDILVKVDRAAMSTSLETRVPLLDRRVVEFAWHLPVDIKYHNNIGKWPLRQIFNKYLPEYLANRPKMGFGAPIDYWLRGPLRDWAEELLSEERLKRQGFFDPLPIRSNLQQHLSGRYDRHYQLWTILMFQAWIEDN
ncbi:MAG: asparagine synthase (glutamine-hydrolyzing) [Bacteroidales bacterium]|nr:asparagine synthase (glutamine-hydrolyzing) [Bacteroidales bacterium]